MVILYDGDPSLLIELETFLLLGNCCVESAGGCTGGTGGLVFSCERNVGGGGCDG